MNHESHHRQTDEHAADGPSAEPVLGQDRDNRPFETAAQGAALASALVGQGRRYAQLFTRDLDPQLYNNAAFVDALAGLLRANPRSHAQVLVQDPENFASKDHRIVTLAQLLSSYLEIRVAPDDAQHELASFMVVDGAGYLYRPHSGLNEGEACFNGPRRARDLSREFVQWWEQGTPLTAARRLYL